MHMKNKIVFLVINALLIAVIGTIVGLAFKDNIFAGAVGTVAFIVFLFNLAIPSISYLLNDKILLGGKISLSAFGLAEFILNIVYMCLSTADIKVYAIIQACLIGILLVAFLIIISLFKEKDKGEK